MKLPIPAEERCKLASCKRRAKTSAGYCLVHDPERQREYRKVNPGQFKGYCLKRDYGISLEAYTEMLVKQSGCCAICGAANGSERSNNNGRKVLAVDHNSRIGAIRGLLCSRCNVGIGNFQENSEWLRKAADYLEAHTKKLAELKESVVRLKVVK